MSLFSKRSTTTTLEGLKAEWAKCQECPFHIQRKNVVMGDGKVGATVFGVGQSPADHEDKTGIPFSGKGGIASKQQFEMHAGIPPDDIFWTNVLACRPFGWMQGVRDDFAQNCWDRLEAELLIVKPKMIVAMGTPAAMRFLPKGSRQKGGEVRGRRFVYRGLPGITILHPAAILRKNTMARRKRPVEDDIKEDMARVREIYDEVKYGIQGS